MNLILDFDGTICDSLGTVLKIVNDYFAKNNLPQISRQQARSQGVGELIRSYKIPKYKLVLYVYYSRRRLSREIPHMNSFPKINEVIKTLSQSNRIGILTSNSRKNVNIFLTNHKLSDYIDFVYSDITLFGKEKKLAKILKKYQLSKSETIYIGDETRDVAAAHKVGIKSVAVTWGFESKKSLAKAKPDKLISQTEKLVSLV